MTITIANRSPYPIGERWIRVNTDQLPPTAPSMGVIGGFDDREHEVLYMRGRATGFSPTGIRSFALDLMVSLSPGQTLVVDPDDWGDPIPHARPAVDFSRFGELRVNGVPTTNVSIRPDGAALAVHDRVRLGRML